MMPASHVFGPREGHAHTHTVILLHGRDSTSVEFASELFESEASEPRDKPKTLPDLFPTIRWVFPTAPVLRSARFDIDMSQWFDMWSTEDPDEQPEIQLPGLRASVSVVLEAVREEERRVDRGKIFVGGISQGFVIAVAAFFAGEGDLSGLGGMIGLCSWMPLFRMLTGMVSAENGREQRGILGKLYRGTSSDPTPTSEPSSLSAVPVFLGHSVDDSVISIRYGRTLRDTLRRFPDELNVAWHEYEDGGHWLNEPQGVDDIADFLRKHA